MIPNCSPVQVDMIGHQTLGPDLDILGAAGPGDEQQVALVVLIPAARRAASGYAQGKRAMSDSFVMLVDQDVQIEEADETVGRVLHRFRDDGLIVGELDADCVLEGEGYRPGPALPKVYELREPEYPFWKLQTCRVEPQVGP